MKILTLVNADLTVSKGNDAETLYPLALTDASLLTGGKPQFLPDLEHKYALYSTAAIQLRNTGKKIAPRFIGRYCSGVAPATLLIDLTELEYSRECGLPYTRAVSFDFNVARGEVLPFSEALMDAWEMEVTAGTQSQKWTASRHAPDWRERMSALSRQFTFRTGDIVLAAPLLPVKVQRDTHVRMETLLPHFLNTNTIYDYNIK